MTHFIFLDLQERGTSKREDASLSLSCAQRSSASYQKEKQSLAQRRAPSFLVRGVGCLCVS